MKLVDNNVPINSLKFRKFKFINKCRKTTSRGKTEFRNHLFIFEDSSFINGQCLKCKRNAVNVCALRLSGYIRTCNCHDTS